MWPLIDGISKNLFLYVVWQLSLNSQTFFSCDANFDFGSAWDPNRPSLCSSANVVHSPRVKNSIEVYQLALVFNSDSILFTGCCSKRDYTNLDGTSSAYQPCSSNTDAADTIDVKCGYSYSFTKTVIFHIVAVCTLGIPYLAIHWSSNLKLFLLMSKCTLSTADCILVNVSTHY